MIVSIPKELCIKSVKDATTIKIIPQKDVISETIVEYVRFVMFRKYKVIYKYRRSCTILNGGAISI